MFKKYKKTYIILHHSATLRDKTTFEAVNNYHKEKWNFVSGLGHYIGYHYFITADGTIHQGRADWEEGAHCYQANKNFDSIGICLAGNFDTEKPSQEQLLSLAGLFNRLLAENAIPLENLKFHRDYAPKTCPGKNINQEFFNSLLKKVQAPIINFKDKEMMSLIQKKGDSEIYAVDKFGSRHSLVNWDTYKRGVAVGLWSEEIKEIENLAEYKKGDLIVLMPDN